MSPRSIARLVGSTRVAVGFGLVASPNLARGMLGDIVDALGGQVAVRALGGRDVWLGALTLYVLKQERPGRWIAALGVSDLADAIAIALAARGLPSTTVARGVLSGLAPAVASILAGRRLDSQTT